MKKALLIIALPLFTLAIICSNAQSHTAAKKAAQKTSTVSSYTAEGVGAACSQDSDCGEDLQCLSEEYIAGGYCTITECERTDCPEGSICYEIDTGLSACLKLCTEYSECRVEEGHTCSPEMDTCWGAPGEDPQEPTTTTTSIAASGSFSYVIDPGLHPAVESLPGIEEGPERRIAAVMDYEEYQTDFVVDEVILYAPEQSILDTFITQYGAEVIQDSSLPDPPQTVDPQESGDKNETDDFYLLRVNLDAADMSEFEYWMEQLEFTETFRFSSEEAVWLSAIIAKERVVNGLNIEPNITVTPFSAECVTCETEEYPKTTGSGYENAFSFAWLNDSDFGVTWAWQYYELLELAPSPVKVAMVDAGFSFNSDFPTKATVPQYNYVTKKYDVDGQKNSSPCTGGSLSVNCQWHGNGAYGIALAIHDNQFGSAGTSAATAEPVLFNHDGTFSGVMNAIDSARYWGSKVINANFGASCNWWCRNFGSEDNYAARVLNRAINAGAVVVAPAGNEGNDVYSTYLLPCIYKGTLCIGGLDPGTKKADPSSSYGTNVDMWAPYGGMLTTPNPGSTGPVTGFGGTCASAPYVAGVVAIMKAINPTLDYWSVKSVLQSTSNKTNDPKVSSVGYINAYAAVKSVASSKGYSPKGDIYEPNNTEATATLLSSGTLTATTAPDDDDYFYFETTDFADLQLVVTYKDTAHAPGSLNVKLNGQWGTEKIKGTVDLSQKLLPPGKHVLHIYAGTAPMNCYTVQFSTAGSAMQPDKYDKKEPGNDSYDTRAVITEKIKPQGNALVSINNIYDLNFHDTGDIDFFEITLGEVQDECADPTKQGENFTQGYFGIHTYPALPLGPSSIEGVKWPFEIKVYNSDKSEFSSYTSKSGYNLKIECPRTNYFKDGKIMFSVTAKDGRRNYYDIGLYYSPAVSGALIPPVFDEADPGEIWVIPPWEEGVIPWLFPSNPIVIEQYFAGELGDEIPSEYGVLQWEQAGDLDLYMFTEGRQDLQLTLYDENKQVLGTTGTGSMYRLMTLDEQDETEEGHIHVADLPAGTYVLEFNQGDFGTVYSLSIGEAASVLSVHNDGTGSGTVESNPGGIFCGGACEHTYQQNTTIHLSATPDDGSRFSGWESQQCSGTDNCTVSLSADTEITARFTAEDVETSDLSLDPAYHDFGVIGVGDQSELAPFFVGNESAEEIIIQTVTLTGEHSSEYTILTANCIEEPLQPKDECLIEVVFNPQSEGEKPAVLFIHAETGQQDILLEAELLGEASGESEYDDDDDTGDDDDDNDEGGCPVARMLGGNQQHLDTLYRFRDGVLVVNKKGAAYSKLYYNYQDELSELFIQHPELFGKAQHLLQEIIPLLKTNQSRPSITVTHNTVSKSLDLISDMIAVSKGKLKKNIIRLQEDIQTGTLLRVLNIQLY